MAEAYTSCSRVSKIGSPKSKFTICPTPKVKEDTIMAAVTLDLHIPLKRSPRKITSSRMPTKHMLRMYRRISRKVARMVTPHQKFTLEMKINGR